MRPLIFPFIEPVVSNTIQISAIGRAV